LNPTALAFFDVVFAGDGAVLVPLDVVVVVEVVDVCDAALTEEVCFVVAPMVVGGRVSGTVVEGKPTPFGPIEIVFPSITTVVPVAPGGKL